MTQMTEAYDWRGRTLVDQDGEKIGKVDEIYVDNQNEEPEWARVTTGLFGSNHSYVPLAGASPQGENVGVSVSKEQVKNAPDYEADGELSQEQEAELFRHYGIDYTDEGSVTATPGPETAAPADGPAASERPAVGHDTSGPTTDDAMTRSEEELHVGTAERERGRARLRKYVVTEQVETTVPVKREEVRLEREPITDGNVEQATDGPAISDEEHEVVLHEEEIVAEKRVVPKERVRLDKETVTDERQVSEEIQKEQIEADDGTGAA
ncbi:MAG: putative conserved domain protein [uncultured Solirubrobacterales bacterium]|uniref:Putative conserved domain protein n=1 Tax=uncultured Solirubrobacterales bacterium TaxID=768556 RepID=A0A6J4RZ54_9ACTN|nr:MAG: putative conserved domain protein [uncultured Solirubrobacterales bacterium]